VNLRDLEYLVAVAEHRHFGRAAAACYISQPTLSTQLKKLESELGVALVERSPRQALLTAAGEQVVERARAVLGEIEAIRGIARRAKNPRSGRLRLGVFPTLAPYLLPHVVPNLHERFPDLELLLVEEKSEVLTDQLRVGRLDAAVLALPVPDPGLDGEPLFREEFLLAVPAGHRLAGEERVSVDALEREHLLLLQDGHCLRDQALEVCALAGAQEYVGFQATSLETLRHMVAAGVGVTLLPELSVQPPVPRTDRVRLLRFTDPAPYREIGLFWRPANVYRDLLGEVAQALRDPAPGPVVPLVPAPRPVPLSGTRRDGAPQTARSGPADDAGEGAVLAG
jgi:LysR family hydrogen peroxide-inducible transcriptional activator